MARPWFAHGRPTFDGHAWIDAARGGDSWELRVYLGRHPETGKERWATRTVHGSRRNAGHQLQALVEEAHAARIHAGTMAELFERWFAAAAPGWSASTIRETRSLFAVT
jgi:hypothetical protein